MPNACQCSRGNWIMPWICFYNWLALKWSESWARWSLNVPSNWTTPILFCSILTYPILFHSILLPWVSYVPFISSSFFIHAQMLANQQALLTTFHFAIVSFFSFVSFVPVASVCDLLFLIWPTISDKKITALTDQLYDRLQCLQKPKTSVFLSALI